MAIQVQCGDCFQSFCVREELVGKTIRCKSCSTAIRVTRDTSTDSAPKAGGKSASIQDDFNDPDESEVSETSARRTRRKPKPKRASSFPQMLRWFYDTPWTFLVIAVTAGLVASWLMPERFDVGQHLIVLREVPIGAAYLLVACIWYLAVGGYSERRQMSFAEQWVANFKLRLQMIAILALLFGVIQLDNIFGRLMCAVVVIGLVIWKARDVKPHEWRPLCLVFIGVAHIGPTLVAMVQDMRR